MNESIYKIFMKVINYYEIWIIQCKIISESPWRKAPPFSMENLLEMALAVFWWPDLNYFPTFLSQFLPLPFAFILAVNGIIHKSPKIFKMQHYQPNIFTFFFDLRFFMFNKAGSSLVNFSL